MLWSAGMHENGPCAHGVPTSCRQKKPCDCAGPSFTLDSQAIYIANQPKACPGLRPNIFKKMTMGQKPVIDD